MKRNKTNTKLIMFKRGIADCKHGVPAKSINPVYLIGYGIQYSIEQRLSGVCHG